MKEVKTKNMAVVSPTWTSSRGESTSLEIYQTLSALGVGWDWLARRRREFSREGPHSGNGGYTQRCAYSKYVIQTRRHSWNMKCSHCMSVWSHTPFSKCTHTWRLICEWRSVHVMPRRNQSPNPSARAAAEAALLYCHEAVGARYCNEQSGF